MQPRPPYSSMIAVGIRSPSGLITTSRQICTACTQVTKSPTPISSIPISVYQLQMKDSALPFPSLASLRLHYTHATHMLTSILCFFPSPGGKQALLPPHSSRSPSDATRSSASGPDRCSPPPRKAASLPPPTLRAERVPWRSAKERAQSTDLPQRCTARRHNPTRRSHLSTGTRRRHFRPLAPPPEAAQPISCGAEETDRCCSRTRGSKPPIPSRASKPRPITRKRMVSRDGGRGLTLFVQPRPLHGHAPRLRLPTSP